MDNIKITFRNVPLSYFATIIVFLVCSNIIDLYLLNTSSIISLISYGLSAVVLALYFIKRYFTHQIKTNLTFKIIIIAYLFLFIVTLALDGSLIRCIGKMVPIVSIGAFTIMQCKDEYGQRVFVKALSDLFFFLSFVNLLSVLLFRKGFNQDGVYLIGMKNHIGHPLCIGFLMLYIETLYTKKSFKLFVYTVVSALSLFLVFSRASIIGFGLIVIGLLFHPIKSFFQNRSLMFHGLLFSIGLILFMLFSNYILNIPAIKYLIVDVLNKDISLGSRTSIWNMAIGRIGESPLWGHGIRETYNLFELRTINGLQVFSAHNQYIQTLYEGGIMTLVLILSTIIFSNYYLNQKPKSDLSFAFKIVSSALLIMLCAEAVEWKSFLFVMNIVAVFSLRNNNSLFEERFIWNRKFQK